MTRHQRFPIMPLLTALLLAGMIALAVPPCSAGTGSAGVSGTQFAAGSPDRTWSFEIDTSTFKPDEYLVTASAVKEDVTATALFNVLERPSRSPEARPFTARASRSVQSNGGYYITIDPVGDRFVGDRFAVTGHTNLPEGTEMLVQVYSSSFKPTQKSQSGEFSGATGTIRAGGPGGIAGFSAPGSAGSTGTGPDTKIIRTGSVTLEVQDITQAAGRLHDMAISEGGYISSSAIQSGGSRHNGNVVLRVPAARFDAAMAGIGLAGSVLYLTTEGQDVTEEYTDLGARKKAYRAQLEQYYALMNKATSVADILAIRQQIDRVQTELEQVEGRIRYLDSRIDLATITVTLREPEPIRTETGHSFAAAFNAGIAGLFSLIDAAIIATITFFPLILAAGAGLFWYRRRMTRPVAAPAGVGDLQEKEGS